jgi:aryl-alcohol dehydrogenase-like predicted oxidoreductase
METRPLGTSGLAVSRLALGSWRTFERIPREAGVAVMVRAREAGIAFLDDARYDDETGTAPLATGYSEVVFGELFRAAGWRRDEVVVANKLWWEFWPAQSAAAELDASLARMGFEMLDLAYAAPMPEGLGTERSVAEIGGLIASGRLRAWGTLNWRAADLAAAVAAARDQGVPPPCATQLPYSLVRRTPVESGAMAAALDAGGVAVVASAVLAGGALTGTYAAGDGRGRLAGRTGDGALGPALAAGGDLVALSRELGASPAALAVAFALANPRVASVLFGATAPDQVDDDVAALDVLAGLDAGARAALAAVGAGS